MDPEGSSPHSQAPATCPYPEPAQSIPHTLIPPEHPVYKMWIIREPNKLALWNKLHLEEEKNGEYRACLKYSVPIFVE